MSRQKGTAITAFNIEPHIAAPLDARTVVQTKADLTADDTFLSTDGNNYAFVGMPVSVTSDSTVSNNGLYTLMALPTTIEANWQKAGGDDPRIVSELNGKGYNVSTAQGLLDVLNQFRTMASCGRIYIHLAAGTYNFTSGIQFRNWNTGNATSIFIEGSGVDSTILNFTGVNDYTGCIDMQDCGVLNYFGGFTINQNATKSHQEGIRCQTSRCIINDVKVTNCDEGITAGTGGHVTLYNNITTNNCTTGLYSVGDMYHGYGVIHTANTCTYGMSAASGGRIAMMGTKRVYTGVTTQCTPSLGASTGSGWVAGYWYA